VGTDNKHIAPPSIQPASNIGITSLNVGILWKWFVTKFHTIPM